MSRLSMEEARVCIQNSCKDLTNEVGEVPIDGTVFSIIFREDFSLSKVFADIRKSSDEEYSDEYDFEEMVPSTEEEGDKTNGRDSVREEDEEESTGQNLSEKGGSVCSRKDGEVSNHSQQSFIFKGDPTSIGHKGSSDPIENAHVLKYVPPHSFNTPLALNVPILSSTSKDKDVAAVVQRNKELAISEVKSTGPSVELNKDISGGTGLGLCIDLGRYISTGEMGHKFSGILSFDKACSLVRSPRRRKKKAVADLGWNVECSRSY